MKTIPLQLNGIYRAPQAVDELRAAPDLQWTAVSLKRIRGKRALLKALALAMDFPATFGGNWDALADCLQDLSWLAGSGHVLHLQGFAGFSAAAPAEQAVLLDILGAAAEYWRRQGRTFIVLVDGDSALPEFPAWR